MLSIILQCTHSLKKSSILRRPVQDQNKQWYLIGTKVIRMYLSCLGHEVVVDLGDAVAVDVAAGMVALAHEPAMEG